MKAPQAHYPRCNPLYTVSVGTARTEMVGWWDAHARDAPKDPRSVPEQIAEPQAWLRNVRVEGRPVGVDRRAYTRAP